MSTQNFMEAIALEYARGRLSDGEMQDLLGSDADEVRFVVRKIREGKRQIEEMVE